MSSLRGNKRTEFPLSVRKKAFARCCQQGTRLGIPQCENCGIELSGRTGLIYEHMQPDGLSGEPTIENCRIFCFNCADIKTHTEDNPRMAKADRVLKKHFGLEPFKKKIQSAGFRPSRPQRTASRPLNRKHSSTGDQT